MEIARYLEGELGLDLADKMVLVAGPRQVGKTTLARRILARSSGAYYTWDRADDRRRLLSGEWPAGKALIVLDELHKYRSWKRWLKGEFDAHRDRLSFLVTGSARLDIYRRGGDSLQGRYHHYRLHPLSCAELARTGERHTIAVGDELPIGDLESRETLLALLEFGGFPEPFLAQSERSLRRWRKDRVDRFFREDVRDLDAVRDLSSVQLLAQLLEERVGSLLSRNAIREDLLVSHKAVSNWLDVLERLYYIFAIKPYVSRSVRALQKMTKTYLWDSSSVRAEGARFENLVALHLLKFCHYLEDAEGHRLEVRYLRDREGREVDFLVTLEGRPWFAVEAKIAETRIEPALLYYRERLDIPFCYQVVRDTDRDFVKAGVRCLPAYRFLTALV